MFEIARHVGRRRLPGLSRGPTSHGRRSSTRSARTQRRWVAVRMLAMVVATFGLLSIVPTTVEAQGRPKKAYAPRTAPKLDGSLILGEIESIAVDDMNDASSSGRLVVQGKEITIPRGLSIGLPTGRLTLRNLVLDAPDDCKSQQPPQSGLAVSDTCRKEGTPALARIVANPDESGRMVAKLVMVQKDSARTIARMRPDSPRAARARAAASHRLNKRQSEQQYQ
jgi:hypothetical protein